MSKILLLANYKKSVGGISGQVEILMKEFEFDLFNTKTTNFKRLFLPLKLLFKGRKYDTFHIHGCCWLGFFPIVVGVVIGKLLNKKIIITYHGGGIKEFINKHPRCVNFFLTKANKITVPSRYLLDILCEYNIDAQLLHNVVRIDNIKFRKRDVLSPVFITTRSLEPVYNIQMAIDAFKVISLRHANSKLYIVGDGSLRAMLEKYVKEMELEKNIIFTGRVSNDEIGTMLDKADIYISPTTEDNMPLSLFEALASGLLVISTDVGGIPNFIDNGINGYLVESNNTNQLVETIEIVLCEQNKTKEIIEQGIKSYQKYTWETLETEYREIYFNL